MFNELSVGFIYYDLKFWANLKGFKFAFKAKKKICHLATCIKKLFNYNFDLLKKYRVQSW